MPEKKLGKKKMHKPLGKVRCIIKGKFCLCNGYINQNRMRGFDTEASRQNKTIPCTGLTPSLP